ncbi:DNA sulfur modification protein DndD [Butyricimonas sp. An62]|jgi:DNA sulfur modification protein DndD|uniref:DNA sulfur modification protein DndD n=1 Tax=Butyricimonas sp. An62 TaxID=1965649 RepID=UPI000B36F997|nr:DNA sulfur modification protein DndD [Butyricimonas sp. An62]OUN66294.1 DNA sulfur modification protein DndD [Butyricimonas sp. An62]
MIIRNITIENFQSYYESQTIEFSKGLNLIIGNGGKGKSKLFNAFYWVLFGKIYITGIGWCTTDNLPQSAKFAMQRYEFINKRALFKAQINDKIRASVQIEIEDDKGNDYIIERSVSALRLEGEEWDSNDAWQVGGNMLKVSFDSTTGTKVLNDLLAEDKINELFPDGIRNYIWFQGESLESLINFRNKETLKAAVKHISYFPYYEKLSEIISKSKLKITGIESRKLKEVNKHNSSVKGLLSTIDNLNYKISREEENKKQFETHIETIKIALADGETKISGLASYSMLVKKYKDCENEINKLLSETTRIDEFQREKLPSLWVLRGIEPMIQQCKEIIEKHKEEEYTVPEKKYLDNPSRSKLEEILKDKKCFVCGTEFSENDAPYHYITERLRLQEEYLKEMEEYTSNMQLSKQFNMFVGKIQDYPDSLLISLSKIDKQWKDSEDELERYMAQRRRKQDEKRKLDEQIEDIKKKHGVDPVTQAETAGIINSSIRASRSNLETLQRKLDVSKQTLSNYRSELRIAERELEKLGAKDTTVAKVPETEWKHISTFLEDICKRVQENARKDLLHKIEERANLFYAKFTEHDNGYKGNVKIGEDYSIEFDAGLNTSHEDRKKMSIINALLSLNQEAMGTYYPFISDAPTSSFDLETTHKYLLGIKDIFGQSIVLTKDVDLESDKYLDLQNQSNVSRIYNLESKIYSGDANRGQHEVSTQITILK